MDPADPLEGRRGRRLPGIGTNLFDQTDHFDEQPFVSEETGLEETFCSKRPVCRDYPEGPSSISGHP